MPENREKPGGRQLEQPDRLLHAEGFVEDGIARLISGCHEEHLSVATAEISGPTELLGRLEVFCCRLGYRMQAVEAISRRRASEDNAWIGSATEQRIRRELEILEAVLDGAWKGSVTIRFYKVKSKNQCKKTVTFP